MFDCLNEIFEILEEDKITLHSCLLVNRLWCKISVRILWKNIWSFKYSIPYDYRFIVSSTILSTLIACLSNESKELYMRIKFLFQHLLQNLHYLIMYHFARYFQLMKLVG